MSISLDFDARVQRALVLTQREARRFGHATLYPAHLLLGVTKELQENHHFSEPAAAIPLVWLHPYQGVYTTLTIWQQRNQQLIHHLRRAIQQQYGPGGDPPTVLVLSAESKQCLRSARLAAHLQHATTIATHHLLLGILDTHVIDSHIMTAIMPYLSPLFESDERSV